MTALLIFILIFIGLNQIPRLTKMDSPKLEQVITRIMIFISAVFIIFTTVNFMNYELKGVYTKAIIGVFFISSSLLFFSLVRNTRRKVLMTFFITPLMVISLITLLITKTTAEYPITDLYKIEVSEGGFLACGQTIKITENKSVIFDRIIYKNNLCLTGIKNIKTIKFNNDMAEFLIYHNGELDSENPYKYQIENKNVW